MVAKADGDIQELRTYVGGRWKADAVTPNSARYQRKKSVNGCSVSPSVRAIDLHVRRFTF